MKHRVFSLLLALCLLAALALPGFAAGDSVQRSPQSLRVNGVMYDCEKYNINDSNYFKLRDLAKLLNGTASQFSVDYDEAAQTMVVKTGEAYTKPNGTELRVGADKSATAVKSSQKLRINGVVRTDLTVWNIGDSNYFKLRELGDALGFNVDYDPDINTAIVKSRDYVPATRLALTPDAGHGYLDKMVFLGDSTTYGIGYYYRQGFTDLCPPSQVWTPKSGTLTLSYWSTATIVYPATGEEIGIEEAARRAKPEYMVITLGVNGISFMDENWFIMDYTALVQAIQAASPNTKIILNSIYPVAPSYKYQGSINNVKIRAANGWIERIAAATGCRYVHCYDAVVGTDGNLPETAHNGDGLHLTGQSFGKVMNYLRTHKYQ